MNEAIGDFAQSDDFARLNISGAYLVSLIDEWMSDGWMNDE